MRKTPIIIGLAFIFTLLVLLLGYILLGIIPMFLFSFGFLGGFILWLVTAYQAPVSVIKIPPLALLLM